jgi:hypothetical protein
MRHEFSNVPPLLVLAVSLLPHCMMQGPEVAALITPACLAH